MTKPKFFDQIIAWPTAVAAMAGVIATVVGLSGFVRADHLTTERVERIEADVAIRRELELRDNLIQRKLDCALFELPKDCRQTMSPRMP